MNKQKLVLENYFDYAATSPLDPLVVKEMEPYWCESFGNAHSIHGWGQAAKQGVKIARERLAKALGAEDPSQIYFTSGATEANNWVLMQFSSGASGPWEHDSIREPSHAQNFHQMTEDDLLKVINKEDVPFDTSFLSVSSASNETGAQIDAEKLCENGRIVHTDGTQKLFKYHFDLGKIEYVSCSSHKFYGPKGVGFLYTKSPTIEPFILGGHQESHVRAGTLNVPSIVGMGLAAEIATANQKEFLHHTSELRALIVSHLTGTSDVIINGGENPVPHILSVSFRGIVGESLVIALDSAGFAVSSGSACSFDVTGPGPTLLASSIPMEYIRGTIRISMGRYNTLESAERLAKTIVKAVGELRSLQCN